MPLVSVVMSVYNGAVTVGRSIESVLTQEGVDFEFIIVNDGSKDGTAGILDGYAARDARVRVIHQENCGLTRALIRGCGEARGEFIARQDADDISLPERLVQQTDVLRRQPEVAFVTSWVKVVGPGRVIINIIKLSECAQTATQNLIYARQGPIHGSVTFRKQAYEAVGGYRSMFYYAQDADLWLRMAQVGQISCIQTVLYEYFFGPGAISTDRHEAQKLFGDLGQACHVARLHNKNEEPFLSTAEKLCEMAHSKSKQQASRRSIAASYYFIGSNLQDIGNRKSSIYFINALRANPFHWRALIKLAKNAAMFYKKKH